MARASFARRREVLSVDLAIVFKIVLIGIVTTIATLLLKRAGREEIATVASLVGLAIALVMMLDVIVQLYDSVRSLFDL